MAIWTFPPRPKLDYPMTEQEVKKYGRRLIEITGGIARSFSGRGRSHAPKGVPDIYVQHERIQQRFWWEAKSEDPRRQYKDDPHWTEPQESFRALEVACGAVCPRGLDELEDTLVAFGLFHPRSV